MRYVISLLFVFFYLSSFSQTPDTTSKAGKGKPGVVTFTTTIDAANATKDGIYLNGYVVNLPYDQIKKLHGKKVKVTGKVTIVKGIKDAPSEPLRQGRAEDTEHILHPGIEIIHPRQ